MQVCRYTGVGVCTSGCHIPWAGPGCRAALARYLVCLQSVGQVGVWLTKPEVCLCPVMAEDVGRIPEQHLPQRLGMEGMERCRVQLLQDPQPRSKTPGTHP